MNRFIRFACLSTILAAGAVTGCSRSPANTETQLPPLERGRYLVERVAMCADCHSPRGPQGEFIKDQWLMGSALAFTPAVPMPWSPAAPPIAGMPGYSKEAAIAFLTGGKTASGRPLLPPMPEYRFSRQDGEAVYAYLKSLGKNG